MADVNNLTKIRVINQLNGLKYKLIGFDVAGDDRAGLYVSKLKLYNEDSRTTKDVVIGNEMKNYSILID
jgi:hypothetical protein